MKQASHIVLPSLLLMICAALSVYASTPSSGTLTPPSSSSGTSTVTWSGGPFTAVTADPSLCTSLGCDNFMLTVSVPSTFYSANPNDVVLVGISFQLVAGDVNDFDLYVYDSSGNLVNSSAQGNTSSEAVNLDQLPSGTYRVQVVAFVTVNAMYSGTASLGPAPAAVVRSGKYKNGNFGFTQPLRLNGPSGLVFGVQDLEPRSAFDAAGNIYAAAIQGVPAGTDAWKSTDGGNSFTYLGQPDGAQAASATAGRAPGAGGGDEDIAIGSTGRVNIASLWIGSVTSSSSANGGAAWVANPVSSDVPADDRQWIATTGENIVYLTFKQVGTLLAGTESILVLKSFDGGVTFPQVASATTPGVGVQPGDQGNIVVDESNGFVYTVFVGATASKIYLARSTDGGQSFALSLIFQDPTGTSLANVFPIIAIDRGENLHVVFSNGRNIYLASSRDFGTTWSVPLRVNNGTGTKTSLSPWVDAGDAGKVDITWWGTSSTDNLSDTAQWKVYFAQIENAFARNPTIALNPATPVIHVGAICVNGTGCASGTRNLAEYFANTVYRNGLDMIVYPDDKQTSNPLTYFIRQTSGDAIVSPLALAAAHQKGTAGPEPLPMHYALGQNYPNPFNPTTTIEYDLAAPSHVELRIFSLIGSEVTELVNTDQNRGRHRVSFNASHLPSGVYYYSLSARPRGTGAEGFAGVRRMLLIK